MKTHFLKRPIITEKAIGLANKYNTYTFEVDPVANKNQIKALIEELYEVEVIKVNTTIRAPQVKKTGRRRLPKRIGRIKKALVTLKKGDAIEIFDTYRE